MGNWKIENNEPHLHLRAIYGDVNWQNHMCRGLVRPMR